MRMLRLVCCSLSLIVSGCVSVPEFSESELTTAAVIHHIKCEIREAAISADPNNRYFRNWGIGNKLTLNADQTGSLTANAGLRHPLLPQVFDLSGKATLSGQGTRTERIEFSANIDKLRLSEDLNCDYRPIDDRHALLGGSLGIYDHLMRAIASIDIAGIKPTQLDYTLVFTITKSADATAKFTMLPWGGQKTGTLGGTWSGKRIRTHTLNIALAPPAPATVCKLRFVNPADQELFEGLCPEDIVAIGPDGIARIQQKNIVGEDTGAPRSVPVERNPGASRAIRKQAEEIRIQRALDRSTLQGIGEELQRRGIVP